MPQRFAYQSATDDEQDSENEYFNKPEFTSQQRQSEPKPQHQQNSNLFASLQQQHQQIRQQPQPQTNQNFALYYQQVICSECAVGPLYTIFHWILKRLTAKSLAVENSWTNSNRYIFPTLYAMLYEWQSQQLQRQQQQLAATQHQPSFHYQQAVSEPSEQSAQQYEHYQQPTQFKQAAAPAHIPQKVNYSPASEVSHVKYESEGVNYSF